MTENVMVQEAPTSDTIQSEDSVIDVAVYSEIDNNSQKPQPPKRKIFWKVLSACFALFLAVAAIGFWFFYKYLERYEAATPNAALNTYMQWVREGDFESIYAISDFDETILNTKAEFLKYLSRLYTGNTDTLSVREKVTSTDERKDYSLYMDGKRICGLTLLKNPEWGETAWSYITEINYQPPVKIYASSNARISVNGVDLSLLNLPAKPAQEQVLGGVKDADKIPLVNEYIIENLLNPPTIEALALSGDVCTVSQTDENSYHIFSPVSDEMRAEREELAKNMAFKYAEFVARDASRAEVLQQVYSGSDLYGTIRNFSNHWFTGHDSYTFNDVKISGYTQYTDSDFSCDVSFQPVYKRKNHVIKSTPFKCRLTFVQIDGKWMLLTLSQTVTESTDTTASSTTTTTTLS